MDGDLSFLILLTALFWSALLLFSTLYPHRLFNSVFVTGALFFTAVLVLTLIFEEATTAFVFTLFGIFIILLLVPFLLIFNGITMIKREGRSLANLLSLFLGIGIEIGEIAFLLDVVFNYALGIEFFERVNMLLLFVGISVFYFSFLLLLFVLYIAYFQFVPHRYDFEYIIIHGCGLLNGDKVSKLLSNRIDKAIKAFHKGKDKAMIICSGGKGTNETISEAEAIAGYLKKKGIAEDHILMEDRSTTTEENLIFSNEIINERGGSRRIALVSSNYHIYRCVLLAHRLKIPCIGIGAKVAFYYWPSAVIREFVAVYTTKRHLILILIGYLLVISPFIYMLMIR
ncbi:MAG: YdcF family protein [Erysipelotrichaceae bacterium]|nr:YdcF family protein [Erysipelotrichaceae bacterium]